MNRLLEPVFRRWRLTAFAASAAMLAIAHGFQHIGGLAPCYLCLKQREVYWAALAVALVGMLVVRTKAGERSRRWFNLLLGLIFLFGAGLALYHTGAEWGWWPGPAICGSGASVASPDSMAALLKGETFSAPSCDKPTWIFLGLSMAGWNVLISLVLALFSFQAFRRRYA